MIKGVRPLQSLDERTQLLAFINNLDVERGFKLALNGKSTFHFNALKPPTNESIYKKAEAPHHLRNFN